jgi:hypothetical protein
MFFISFQQQKLLKNLQRVQTALHPLLDLPPSTFSKIVDFIFDVFGEGLVTDLKNRRFFYFSSIFGPTGSLYSDDHIMDFLTFYSDRWSKSIAHSIRMTDPPSPQSAADSKSSSSSAAAAARGLQSAAARSSSQSACSPSSARSSSSVQSQEGMLLHIRFLSFLFKFMERIVMIIRFYCLPFSVHVLLLLCPFSVIALRNSNSKFEFKAIPVQSSRPLGLMRPPRAAERRSFERNSSKKAGKTTPYGDNMFETLERTIVWVDWARIAQKSAKNDHAWHDFFDLADKCLFLGWYL